VAKPSVTRYVSGWLPYWTASSARSAANDAGSLVATVSPFAYEATGTTTIVSHPSAITASMTTQFARRGVTVVPTVTSRFSSTAVATLGGDPRSRAAHVAALVTVARSNPSYGGLDLDYETMGATTDVAQATAARAGYSALVKQLCPALHALRKLCVVTVMARTSDDPAIWRTTLMPWVYDYVTLGASVDRLRIMAYDDHSTRTGAGPVAGLPWVTQVADYAARRVPARKVELGIPLYGYDWAGVSSLRSVTYAQARMLAAAHGAQVSWDPVQQAPHFSYRSGGVDRIVWYDDARAVAARVQLARARGFGGVALWAFGQGDPGTWNAVRALG
jgi:spore germination protein YaaH